MTSQVRSIGGPEPKTWDDYERGCLDTFGGGYQTSVLLAAFQHGMGTVFNLLRDEFPPAEELNALRAENERLRAVADAVIAENAAKESMHRAYGAGTGPEIIQATMEWDKARDVVRVALAALDEARKEEGERCPACKGSYYNPATNRPCRVCHGTGKKVTP